jgi:hypothetical protein
MGKPSSLLGLVVSDEEMQFDKIETRWTAAMETRRGGGGRRTFCTPSDPASRT